LLVQDFWHLGPGVRLGAVQATCGWHGDGHEHGHEDGHGHEHGLEHGVMGAAGAGDGA
jgi:hypothetical protein